MMAVPAGQYYSAQILESFPTKRELNWGIGPISWVFHGLDKLNSEELILPYG